MSKSKGNVIYADDLVNIFGVDAVRYYVLHEIPYEMCIRDSHQHDQLQLEIFLNVFHQIFHQSQYLDFQVNEINVQNVSD